MKTRRACARGFSHGSPTPHTGCNGPRITTPWRPLASDSAATATGSTSGAYRGLREIVLRHYRDGMFYGRPASEPPERPADPAVRRANLRRIGRLFGPYRRR